MLLDSRWCLALTVPGIWTIGCALHSGGSARLPLAQNQHGCFLQVVFR
jgi:hypothetical protein